MWRFWYFVAICELKVAAKCARWEILLEAFESQAVGVEVQQ